MSSEEIDIESVFTLKVDGLKEALKARSLSTSGTKAELQERLLQYVTTSQTSNIENSLLENTKTDDSEEDNGISIELDDVLISKNLEETVSPKAESTISPVPSNEKDSEKESDNIILEEPKIEEQKLPMPKPTLPPSQKKIVLTPKHQSEDERISNRSKRFGVSVSESEKKRSRLEKFGSSGNSNIRMLSGDSGTPSQSKKEQRANRFGITNLTPDDKKKLRQERFSDEKLKQRQQRFGIV